ncbi:MAG: DUF3828 domain-containing protein [Bacteroidales bacterium]|nr:DUF3828 domain-containing protein [Bacteroidales bacterium]
MKKLIFLLCAALMIAVSSCNNNPKDTGDVIGEDSLGVAAPMDLQTQEYIEGRISDMYNYAFSAAMDDADKKFFTPDFYDLQEKVLKKQGETDNLYIDHDHWVMGQDCHNPSFEFVKAEEIGPYYAKAYVNVKAFDDQEKPELVRLTLRYNGDDWMIDDIEEQYEGAFYSHRKIYEEALDE